MAEELTIELDEEVYTGDAVLCLYPEQCAG